MSAGRHPEGASVLRLAVSRVGSDGVRTPAGQSAVAVPHQWRADDFTRLRDSLTGWPPCTCPRHRAAGTPS
ncbi:hypothetical protein ACWEBX_03395 [Streptomyces sp. NPDC005070]